MSESLKHLALIMDGNGRWAQARGQNRFWGHKKGADVAQEIVEKTVQQTNIKHLTLYAFSTENWSRPREEVDFLFKLLDNHLEKKSKTLIENNIILKTIGDLTPLPHSLCQRIESIKEKTKDNTGLTLTLGLNYGGKQEIISTINTFIEKNPGHKVTQETFEKLISPDPFSNPDLIIRTSGEMRLSNFMIWQSAYSELYFTDTLWPDFTFTELQSVINQFSSRSRRFGALSPSQSNTLSQAGL